MANPSPNKGPSSLGRMIAIGLCLGSAAGVGIGLPLSVALDRIELGPLGIAIGAGVGVAIAAIVHLIRNPGNDS